MTRYFLTIHRYRSSIMAINATIMIYVVVVISGAILAQNSHRVATEAGHMSGGGVGGRKLTSTLTPAVGSEGVVGSSSARICLRYSAAGKR